MSHILNRILPARLRTQLRSVALCTIPTMRHLDMERRLRHMRSLGFEPKSILDVGAATGEWSRMVAKIWPGARILGIEPNQRNAARLKEVRTQLPAFEYWQGFLGPERGTVTYSDRAAQTSLLDADANAAGDSTAEMATLDELLHQRGFPAPDLIKLDVQGYELAVLNGAAEALRHCQAVLAEVSYFRFFAGMPTADEVIDYLKQRGFAWYDVMGIYRRPSDDALAQMDLMFVQQDHALRSCSAI